MQSSQSPTLMPLPFASTGGRNTIPEASQLPGSPGAASFADGFPPATRTPLVAGGIPPSGLDMNGILYSITQSTRWAHAGGQYAWNSAFTTDPNVAGYPNGATLMRADLTGFWINTADNNTTNPDATDGSAANWVPGYNYGVTAITGLTNVNVTLTLAQAAKSKITLAGSLTGNVQIIFPAWTKEWVVVNNTTGAFTVTAKTASGTGVALAAGQQKITGDGTNITQPPESIAPAALSTQPVQLGQVGHGQCKFVYTNATTCTLLPFNGQNLIINGVPQKVPTAGVTLSNTGLSASTGYYVYAYMSSGTMALEASATGYTTGTNGVQVKNSDATRTLVGQIYTNSSSQFQFSNSVCGVLSWFNQSSIALQPINGTGTLTATSPTEINSALRVSTIVWSGKYLDATLDGFASAAVSQAAVVTGIGIDSLTTINGQQSQGNSAFAGAGVPCSTRNTTSGSELTLHTFYALGYTSTGSGSWNLNMKVIVMS